MIPKQAIEKAIEGGWMAEFTERGSSHNGNKKITVSMFPFKPLRTENIDEIYRIAVKGGNSYKIALDATFWQALGKALGWAEQEYYCTSGCGCAYPGGDGSHERGCVWQAEDFYWHEIAKRFYDLILTGGDTDKFWEEILK